MMGWVCWWLDMMDSMCTSLIRQASMMVALTYYMLLPHEF